MSKLSAKLTVIVLTFEESLHISRCLESVADVATSILVVDCFSTDGTVQIAESKGATVLQHVFVNYAAQFNWALAQVRATDGWILRLDADEYLSPVLVAEILDQLPSIAPEIDGVYCGRRMTFQRKMIRHGGIFPIRVLRLFRHGRGRCENRWMDEHIKVSGPTVHFRGDIIDDNLHTLTWWTNKHNMYASREAADLLNLKYRIIPFDSVAGLSASQAGIKRWIKESVYARLPGGYRALSYFLYRYIVRFGFLDGAKGTAFHVLQGFWYRYLVDAKIAEVESYLASKHCSPIDAIRLVLGIDMKATDDTSIAKQ